MLIPTNIYIKDFLSIEEIDYNFLVGESVLVQGINLTDEGQESNGSGKSAFQAAIDYALTESCPRKISSNKDLVRSGCEEALLKLTLQNNTDNKYLCIQRTLHIKNPGSLKIHWGDKPWDEESEIIFNRVSEGNRKLQEILGISFADIHNYYLPNELTYVSFFESSDTSVKELIGRFSKTDTINPVFDYIDSDVKEAEQQVNRLKEELIALSTQSDTYRSLIDTEQNRDWEQEKKDRLTQIDKDIDGKVTALRSWGQALDRTKISIDKLSESTTTIEETIKTTRRQLEEAVSDDNSTFWEEANKIREDVEKEQSQFTKKKAETQILLQEVSKSLNEISLILSGSIICPNCSFEFLLDTNKTVDQLKKDKEIYTRKIESINQSIKWIEDEISSCTETLGILSKEESAMRKSEKESRKEVDSIKTLLNKQSQDLLNKQSELVELRKNFSEQEIMTNKLKRELEELKENRIEVEKKERDLTHLKELKSNLNEVNRKRTEVDNNLLHAESDQIEIMAWSERFRGFKSYLANTQLKTITGYTNKFLKDFNTDIEVNIEGYRQLASGEIREWVTPIVYRNGEERPYGLFSKGERGKINYATMLALQTLINLTSPLGGIDLLFSDEVVEGIDGMGLTYLMEALSDTKRTNLVTTHMIKNIAYDKVLTFVKKDNITSIQL